MKIRERWQSLFNHDLNRPSVEIKAEHAHEAWVMIQWAFEEYCRFSEEYGYAIPESLVMEKNALCEALQQLVMPHVPDASRSRPTAPWPLAVIKSWAEAKPFHDALGYGNLDADWPPLYQIASRTYSLEAEVS